MAENTIVTLTSPDGATLNTASKYCEGDIEVIPKLQEKIVTTGEIITADAGYAGLKSVDTTPVFEAGKKSEYDAFWDRAQNFGNLKMYDYAYAGNGWRSENFKPKYSIRPSRCQYMFAMTSILGDLEKLISDRGIVFDTSQSTLMAQMFSNATALTKIPKIVVTSAPNNAGLLFINCRSLLEVSVVVNSDNTFINWFDGCDSLENLTIEGVIGQNGFNVQWSTKLTHDSLMSIINALKDYSEDTSGTEWVVTLGSENKAKLTEDEILIAESKGWRIA